MGQGRYVCGMGGVSVTTYTVSISGLLFGYAMYISVRVCLCVYEGEMMMTTTMMMMMMTVMMRTTTMRLLCSLTCLLRLQHGEKREG